MDMLKKHKKRVWLLAIIVAAICVLALISTLIIRSASERKIAGLLDLGNKYLAELKYEYAVESYLAVVEIDPKCEEAYMGISETYIQMGEYDKAIEYALQGYNQTGEERLMEKAEVIQILTDTAVGLPVDIPERDIKQTISKEEAIYSERIVDGMVCWRGIGNLYLSLLKVFSEELQNSLIQCLLQNR